MKSVEQLRDVLCQQIDKLQAGKTEAKQANAISSAVGRILSSAKLEMDYAKSHGKTATIGFMTLSGPSVNVPIKKTRHTAKK